VTNDFYRDIEVSDHALDEGELLEVFLSKDGEVRADDVEKLKDDGEDAIEMTWARGSAKVLREQVFPNEDGVIFLVESFFLRGEGEIDSFGFAEGEIVLDGLRVIFQVR